MTFFRIALIFCTITSGCFGMEAKINALRLFFESNLELLIKDTKKPTQNLTFNTGQLFEGDDGKVIGYFASMAPLNESENLSLTYDAKAFLTYQTIFDLLHKNISAEIIKETPLVLTYEEELLLEQLPDLEKAMNVSAQRSGLFEQRYLEALNVKSRVTLHENICYRKAIEKMIANKEPSSSGITLIVNNKVSYKVFMESYPNKKMALEEIGQHLNFSKSENKELNTNKSLFLSIIPIPRKSSLVLDYEQISKLVTSTHLGQLKIFLGPFESQKSDMYL